MSEETNKCEMEVLENEQSNKTDTPNKSFFEKWYFWVIIIVFILGIAMFNSTPTNKNNNIEETPTTKVVETKTDTKTETFKNVTFDIPSTWNREEKGGNCYFYTPGSDFLMVLVSDIGTTADMSGLFYETTIQSMLGSLDEATLTSEDTVIINDIIFYCADFDAIQSGEKTTNKVYMTSSTEKTYIFTMADMGTDFKHDNEFQKILSTIKIDDNLIQKIIKKNYDNLYLPEWVRWDMNIDEVKDVCGRTIKNEFTRGSNTFLTFETEETDYYKYGFDYVCIFENDKLKSYAITCSSDLETCEEITKTISDKYGEPVMNKELWNDDTYKNIPDKRNDAFRYGYVSINKKWEFGNSVIVLSWKKDSSSIAYCHPSYEEKL